MKRTTEATAIAVWEPRDVSFVAWGSLAQGQVACEAEVKNAVEINYWIWTLDVWHPVTTQQLEISKAKNRNRWQKRAKQGET